MTLTRSAAFRKYCAALTAALMALQPLGAYAAPITTSLAEVPLQGLNPVKNNVMFTMDDSGSMALPTLPDYVNNRINPIYTGVPPPGPFTAPDDRYSYSWCLGNAGDAVICARTSPPLASSNLNHLYYNPALNFATGKRSDGADLPCEGGNTACSGPWTAVYSDGFAGYPNANSSATTNLLTGYPDEVFCAIPAPTAADLATARTDGSVCRYNGVTYAGIGGYRYPNASFPRRRPLAGNPYYYTIAAVQFCATRDANGWGTGTCGPRWSATNRYVSYGAGGFDPAAFTRVDIVPFAGTNAYGRTYAQEMANFARWYAFSRTRLLAMRTAAGIAFSAPALENTRIGFNTLNTFATNFRNVQDFTPANKASWFTNLYSVTPSGETPALDAVWRIGEYFSNTGVAAGLPGAADPAAVEPGQPDAGKCRQNFHLLATDGYWNQVVPALSGVAGAIGNQDLTVPALPNLPGATGFTPGQPFPLPYREGAGANTTSNTMADIAMYYWVHDLRPDLPDLVQDSIAPWQHIVFYGLSLGAEGTLPYVGSGIVPPVAADTPWPKPISFTATAIDDLWHAAVNGHGEYFNAQDGPTLANQLVSALLGTTTPGGTATAVGLAGAQLTAVRSFGYRTSYENGWWGDVKKYALDPNTGALPVDASGNPANAPIWAATPLLDAQAAGFGWRDNRRILTINDESGAVVAFRRVEDLSNSQVASLTAGWSTIAPTPVPTAQAIVDYLRGDRTNEGDGLSNFRGRPHILGDIVGSAAVPVGAPRQYCTVSDPSVPCIETQPGYTAFASSRSLRTPMVYVGGNDGMLHAFNDSACLHPGQPDPLQCMPADDAGKEAWAFIPKALFTSGDPNDTAHAPSAAFQLAALSYRQGAVLGFDHKFYVNATPRIWDIDFANTNTANPPQTGNDWRTILVGGLGAGGRAVYALDVTTPVALTDTEASVVLSRPVLWEKTAADRGFEELGYVYDAPTLVKTRRYGWVALVASGYNNAGGKGFLFVLNPTNGDLLQKLPLPAALDTGTGIAPTGLSTIRAFTSSRRDPYVLQAYGGDLKGNVWRFDLSSSNTADWRAELIATLTDGVNPQPITTGVRVEIDQNNNVDRYLFVGTGKLLGVSDLRDTSVTNALYVIRDGTRTAPDPAPTPPYTRDDLNAVSGAAVAGVSGPVRGRGRGWYLYATDSAGNPDPRQKVVTDVTADVQTVVAAFSMPSEDPCAAALTSSLYARDYNTGSSVLVSAGGAVVPGIDNIGAIAGVRLIQGQAGSGGSASGDVRVQVTTMRGQVFSFGVRLAGAPTSKHRVSWRLINRD